MKTGISQIVGKRISAVVASRNDSSPRQQLFLVFSDGTQLELYGESFNCASGLDRGGLSEAIRAARAAGGEITKVVAATASGSPEGADLRERGIVH